MGVTYRARWNREKQCVEEIPLDAETSTRSSGPAVISDTLDGVWNPADGKRYDSKSKYYGTLRQNGLEIDDRPPQQRKRKEMDRNERMQDIKRTLDNYGY